MSPILVRPVREQFEHDRVIRILQARYKRKYEVVINPGAEQNASVSVGELAMHPDLVLYSAERGRKLLATVEVETTESINTLEAMAEWAPFGRLRAAFFLYVPVNSIDTARRLCAEYQISPAEIWTYHAAMDQVRFTMVHRAPDAPRAPEPRTPRPDDARSAPVAPARAVEPPVAAAPERAAPARAAASPARPAASAGRSAVKSAKSRSAKKAAPRTVKTAKKAAPPKKGPRPAAGRARPPAKKLVRKGAAKRSSAAKR